MIEPTKTLAKLYEKQGELVCALGVYSKLVKKDNSFFSKIDELTNAIFDAENLIYNPKILAIFSKEELKNFKILPVDQYKKFTFEEIDTPVVQDDKIVSSDLEDEKLFLENLDLDFDIDDFKKQVPLNSTREESFPNVVKTNEADLLLNSKEIPKNKTDLVEFSQKSFDDMRLSEILDLLASKLDKSTTLEEITIAQIKSLIAK